MITSAESVAERAQQGLALLIAQSSESTCVGNADVGHGSTSFDLSDTGKLFEDGKHFDTGNKFIGTGKFENLLEGEFPRFQLVLDDGTGSTSFRSLRERGLPLFRSESRRLRHGEDPSRCPPTPVREEAMEPQPMAAATSAAIEIAALIGSSAWVTARPMTRTSAPDAIADVGVAGRA